MKVLKPLLLILFALILTACGGKKQVTTAKLILAGALNSIPTQEGGAMVYGVSGAGDKFFSIKLPYNDDLILEYGSWSFYVVGWDGDGVANQLEGQTKCGYSTVNLTGGEENITITLNTANCAVQFFGDSSTKEASGVPLKFVPYACAFPSKYGGDRVEVDECLNSVAQSFRVELVQTLPD